jgi:hypothetical protein
LPGLQSVNEATTDQLGRDDSAVASVERHTQRLREGHRRSIRESPDPARVRDRSWTPTRLATGGQP